MWWGSETLIVHDKVNATVQELASWLCAELAQEAQYLWSMTDSMLVYNIPIQVLPDFYKVQNGDLIFWYYMTFNHS